MAFTAVIGAGLAAGASVYGASKTSDASKKAANLQYLSTQNALAQQQGMFNQAQSNVAPYLALGQQAAGTLQNRLTELTTPYAFVAPDLSNPDNRAQLAPGYDFTLEQGLKAAQNSAAARGLGLSGAALKGATSYATGLANSTYGDVFNRAQTAWQDRVTNQTNTYNRLLQASQVGGAVASNFANSTNAASNAMAGTTIAGGNAQATSVLAPAQAWASGISGAGTALTNGLNQYVGQGNRLNGLFMNSDGTGTGYSAGANKLLASG